MSFRKIALGVIAAFGLSVAVGCDSASDSKAPKSETTPGTKNLEKKTPGMGGGAPGAPGSPGPKPQ